MDAALCLRSSSRGENDDHKKDNFSIDWFSDETFSDDTCCYCVIVDSSMAVYMQKPGRLLPCLNLASPNLIAEIAMLTSAL